MTARLKNLKKKRKLHPKQSFSFLFSDNNFYKIIKLFCIESCNTAIIISYWNMLRFKENTCDWNFLLRIILIFEQLITVIHVPRLYFYFSFLFSPLISIVIRNFSSQPIINHFEALRLVKAIVERAFFSNRHRRSVFVRLRLPSIRLRFRFDDDGQWQ